MNNSQLTLVQIAKICNVSPTTVSRVINHQGRISKATQAKVESVLTQYHYTANPIARALKKQPTKLVAILYPPSSQCIRYLNPILRALTNARFLPIACPINTAQLTETLTTLSTYAISSLVILSGPKLWRPPILDFHQQFKKIPIITIEMEPFNCQNISAILSTHTYNMHQLIDFAYMRRFYPLLLIVNPPSEISYLRQPSFQSYFTTKFDMINNSPIIQINPAAPSAIIAELKTIQQTVQLPLLLIVSEPIQETIESLNFDDLNIYFAIDGSMPCPSLESIATITIDYNNIAQQLITSLNHLQQPATLLKDLMLVPSTVKFLIAIY